MGLREDLESTSAALADSTSTPAAETVTESTATSTGNNSTENGSISSTETNATESKATSSSRTDGRDENGRFASKTTASKAPEAGQAAPSTSPTGGAASSTPKPQEATTTGTEPPKPGEPDTTHAPASWRISEQQAWANIPPEAKRAIHRRELETQQRLSRADPELRFAQETRQALAPIERAAQARGATPLQLVKSYVQFDQALSSRDPAVQAQAVAQVIKGYGIPIEVLAEAIDGKGGPPQRQPSYEEMREQLRAEMQAEMRAHQQRSEYASHNQRVAEFAKTVDRGLFNEDIRHDMAALIEGAAARGIELSLQDAYDRAIRANPEAWAIVQQREAAKLAATKQQATQRAEVAGSSVKSRPATPVGGGEGKNSVRADLEAMAASMAGRT